MTDHDDTFIRAPAHLLLDGAADDSLEHDELALVVKGQGTIGLTLSKLEPFTVTFVARQLWGSPAFRWEVGSTWRRCSSARGEHGSRPPKARRQRHARRGRRRGPHAYTALGEPFSNPRYDEWVRRKAAEHIESDPPFRLPSGAVVCAMYQGRWCNVVTAILKDSGEATTAVQRRAKRFNDDERIQAWWTCRATLTDRPSMDDYTQWRAAQAERTGFKTWPPSICSIAQRLGDGSWIAACEHLEQLGPPDG